MGNVTISPVRTAQENFTQVTLPSPMGSLTGHLLPRLTNLGQTIRGKKSSAVALSGRIVRSHRPGKTGHGMLHGVFEM